MKKLTVITAIMLLALCSAFGGCQKQSNVSTSNTSSAGIRAKPDEEVSAKNTTLLIYMVASDLESKAGCATKDIEEICNAKLSNKLNIVIQSGGTTKWKNTSMDANAVQRFTISKKGKLSFVEQVGTCEEVSMVDPDTLSDFLSWGMENYPADRYGVIFWDHGCGSVKGFGYDEYRSGEHIALDDIGNAFKKAEAHVDFIGFDACLMGTIETAYALSDYSDYLIASEETEPGPGWYYTNWISMLAKNPKVSMKSLGTQIIDDFVQVSGKKVGHDATLALFDLSRVAETYSALSEYLSKSRALLLDNGFSQIADARSSVRSYGNNGYEQIDILSYMEKAGVEDDSLTSAIQNMIVYYNGNISDSTGLAMYYPYSYPGYYSKMNELMSRLSMNNEQYLGYFNDFISILSGGQKKKSSKASVSSIQQLTNTSTEEQKPTEDYTDTDWYNADAAENNVDFSALFNPDGDLTLTEKEDGSFILDLTEEQWKAISKAEMEVYFGDEEGYAYYGLDSLVHYDDNGDLLADFDFYWVTINQQFVPFFIVSDEQDGDKWEATGYVPAILNANTDKEEDINLYIRWNNENEFGYVIGYTSYQPEDGDITVAPKNYLDLNKGDTLDFYTGFYNLDGTYDNSYFVGDTLTVTEDGLTVAYYELAEDTPVEIGYKLTDMYQNEYWTEVLQY